MTRQELWDLSPEDFNKWRRENDLKKLLETFDKVLPHFNEWLETYKFSHEFILNSNKIGSFFYWNTETLLVKSNEADYIDYFFVPIEDKIHDKRISKISAQKDTENFRFKPYFLWAKEKLKSNKIISTKYSGDMDTFRFISGVAPDVPEVSSTSIAPGIQVLKLGAVKINGWDKILNRNLDFTNLDYLEVDGHTHWNIEHSIFYSSCRKLKLNNCTINFTNFFACHFENLIVDNSIIYATEFHKCDLFGAKFENTSLINIYIIECYISKFSFNKVEVDNLVYEPPRKNWYMSTGATSENIMENYKRFRVLYQNNGHTKEAGEAYYYERLFSLKYNYHRLGFKQTFLMMFKIDWHYTKTNLSYNIQNLLNIISDFSSFLLWGFGEKPIRTVYSSILILSLYTAIYYFSPYDKIGGDLINSFYLSSMMFTTIGIGDFGPITKNLKIILATEGIIWAFIFGLFVAGYANKSKY